MFFNFHPDPWGFMIQFDEHIFSDGLVQPPTRKSLKNIPFIEVGYNLYNPFTNHLLSC